MCDVLFTSVPQHYDLRDPDSILKCIKYADFVVNLTGSDYETRHFKFDDVHVTGAQYIAEACKKAGIKKLIHFSALNADKESSSAFLQSKACVYICMYVHTPRD